MATASPVHWLLVRKHLRTGELAFHYRHVPAGRPVSLHLLVAAAGLRWPVEESFEFGKDLFGLDQSQVRRYEAIRLHTVLVMLALAVYAVAAASARPRTDTQAPRRPARTPRRPPTPGTPRCRSQRSRTWSTPCTPATTASTTPSTGRTGETGTEHEPAGTTSEPASAAH